MKYVVIIANDTELLTQDCRISSYCSIFLLRIVYLESIFPYTNDHRNREFCETKFVRKTQTK